VHEEEKGRIMEKIARNRNFAPLSPLRFLGDSGVILTD